MTRARPPQRAVTEERPAILRLPLAGVERTRPPARSDPCPRCGSHGFTAHQRSWKRIKDPQVRYVPVDRYRCKRCGWVGRSYPAGIGPGRQSDAQRQLSILLYAAGLSYAAARTVLQSLGCPMSETTVRHNMEAARRGASRELGFARLQLSVVGEGMVAGADGCFTLRLVGSSPADRWLEVEIEPGSAAAELRWRLEQSAQWVGEVCGRAAIPPGTA